MSNLFANSQSFASLSLKDLIEARDLFHFHLMNKRNVVATALGPYRIRKSDPPPSSHGETAAKHSKKRERRTLYNSEVRPYSWPSVYVFVSSWQYETDLAEHDPSDVVPKTLYLPDGRTVPVCVIEARKQDIAKDLQVKLDSRVPRNLLGPGSAIINLDGQGMTRLATAGCIVRDGSNYYVLTNRHAVGAPGTRISALQDHRQPEIGTSADIGITAENFSDVYPSFLSTRQRLLMDAGLVRLDNILEWKTEVPGIAPTGPVLDLYDNSLSLQLVNQKVVGYSAVSGLLRGEIQALFYRHKAMGGSEYISDFLIGPESDPATAVKAEAKKEDVSFAVHHGDSGTMLFIENTASDADVSHEMAGKSGTKTYYPFALLWGKEEFFEDGKRLAHPFALATSLSTVLDRLELDLVSDLNADQDYIWGWVGHYAIGRALSLPTDLLSSTGLKKFITKNLNLLAVDPNDALDNDPKVISGTSTRPNFVPLADVPDNVWKSNVNFTSVDGDDGKKHRKPGPGNRGQNDNPNHFADMDLVYREGKTFLELNKDDPAQYLNPQAWLDYFEAMKPKFQAWQEKLTGRPDHKNHWGALPFRVHQLFDVMKYAALKGNEELFLCAGGVLIHYMGDACQPLHTSYLSQGDPDRLVQRPRSGGMKMEADGVHSGYEDDMIAHGYTEENLAETLKSRITALQSEPMPPITSGYEASKAVIDLVAKTHADISPRDIVDKWVELSGTPKKQKAEEMWNTFGDRTITCMARGTRFLAAVWQGAWTAGKGDTNLDPGKSIGPADIMKLYNDPDIVPSVALDSYPDTPDSDWSQITRAEYTPHRAAA